METAGESLFAGCSWRCDEVAACGILYLLSEWVETAFVLTVYMYCLNEFCFPESGRTGWIQQSRKLAAIKSSKAISGAIGNSGISVELFV